jgi:(2Fe-2S) ferredoxin
VAKRERYLFVCNNQRPLGTPKGSCATRGSAELHAALKAELTSRGLAAARVRACTSSCLDVCWAGPIVAVTPDDVFLGRVTIEDVPSIVDALALDVFEHPKALPAADFEMSTAGPMLPERAVPPTGG